MTTILNPTPMAAQTFNGMWVQHLNIVLPSDDNPRGMIQAYLLPYDGSNLLALGGKRVTKPIPSADATTTQMIDKLKAEVARLSGNATELLHIMVSAQDPTKPVRAIVRFADNTGYSIANCFALAADDLEFATAFSSTLAQIGRLAGLKIQ